MKILIAGTNALTKNYVNALTRLNAEAFVTLDSTDISLYDGLLLPGGGDIHPSLWGEKDYASRALDQATDIKQLILLNLFAQKKIPILGICKGMQLINVYFGGSIIQHLDRADLHEYTTQDHVHGTHTVSHNLLTELYGSHFATNSAHHQGVRILGNQLTALQYSDDGVMEALSHNKLPILGVQWHPERMCFEHARKDTVDGSLLLQHFLKLCG